MEWFTEYSEIRANIYMPISSNKIAVTKIEDKFISSQVNNLQLVTNHNQIYENPLGGFDVNVGGQFPSLSNLMFRKFKDPMLLSFSQITLEFYK